MGIQEALGIWQSDTGQPGAAHRGFDEARTYEPGRWSGSNILLQSIISSRG
jgi:hypothetical protein